MIHRLPLLCSVACLFLAVHSALHAEAFFETTNVFPTAPKNKPNYRIPSLIQMPSGTLLAIVEKRNDGIGDVGNHDMVLKRSTDLGKTWSAEQVIIDDGTNTSTDTTLCFDRQTGRLFAFFLKDKKEFAYMQSDDEGQTWQGPTVIHKDVIKPEWETLGQTEEKAESTTDRESGKTSKVREWKEGWLQRYGVGPGNAGIQLTKGPHAGRLLVPARHREMTTNKKGRMRSFTHILYSDDHGKTWKLGPNVADNGSETQLLELADGRVLASMRDESGEFTPDKMLQLISISADGGMTWSPARRQAELITPRVHASIKRLSLAEGGDKNRIMFSNPAWPVRDEEHPYGRYNLSVRLSYDEGETWTPGKTIYADTSSYSDLVALNDGSIGIIYERGPKGSVKYWDELQFARFNLEWLTDGRDSSPLKPKP